MRSLLRRVWRPFLIVLMCAGVVAVPSVADAAADTVNPRHDMKVRQASASPEAAQPPITYHGGPIILGTTNVYVIWYGNWPGSSTTPGIISNLLNNIGGSRYFNINTTYFNGAGTHVTNAVALKSSINDNYSQGSALSDAKVKTVVASAINAHLLPSDTNGLYFVLTSSDVAETSGFLTQYCGWHTHGSIGGKNIKYSFVGDASLAPQACMEQSPQSPNGNAAADGMASIIAHELEESATDPDLNAWYDTNGMENADKCAWTFGRTYTANGAMANMKFGGKDYLIQRNWLNSSPTGKCALKL